MAAEKKNTIGPRVRQARVNLEISASTLAARLQMDGFDISGNGVAKIENGWRKVSDVELAKIAAALNVSSAWLLGEVEEAERSKA